MENASKALIIAGAILLSILLISLGIMIFSQAQDTVTNSGMSEAEITTFNNKFVKYEGNRKGTIVKTLIQEVMAANAEENNVDAGIKILINGAEPTGSSEFLTSETYVVAIEDKGTVKAYDDKGFIHNINITEK